MAQCLAFLDEEAILGHYLKHENPDQYRTLLGAVKARDIDAFRDFYTSDEYLQRGRQKTVTLTRDQALQMAQGILGVDKDTIKCDFGNGVFIVLPRGKAYRLAGELKANTRPTITLRFNT